MKRDETTEYVRDIMLGFANLTGLEPARSLPRRYLWTDSFAVCNFLELYGRTGDGVFRDLALHLVDQVHYTLGRHREDDPRKGWISGLDEKEGELHPTRGGLRIGKRMNERKPGEPSDERLEWSQDGQYYHYLTKWMHALNRVSRITRDPTYSGWAIELAKTAHSRFTDGSPSRGRRSMFWKMSIDLTHPLVPSMGQHDPLDGFVTYCELQATAETMNPKPQILPDLKDEISDMAGICRRSDLITNDPLGIGGLMFDAARITQLIIQRGSGYTNLLENIVNSAGVGIEAFLQSDPMQYPAGYRLAFRELGLSIGISGVEKTLAWIDENPDSFGDKGSLKGEIEDLTMYKPLKEEIECFWMDRKNRRAVTWIEHQEINMVMLATSLASDGFLLI